MLKKRSFRKGSEAPLFKSCGNYVYRSQLCAVLGIRLGIERNLLTLIERLEPFGLNCRKVNEDIIAAVVVGNEAIALLSVKPLYRTSVHSGYLH